MDKDLSRTKERLTDTDAKAVAAAARLPRRMPKRRPPPAPPAPPMPRASREFEVGTTAAKSVDTLREDVRNGKFKMTKSDTVLFGFNRKSSER